MVSPLTRKMNCLVDLMLLILYSIKYFFPIFENSFGKFMLVIYFILFIFIDFLTMKLVDFVEEVSFSFFMILWRFCLDVSLFALFIRLYYISNED